MMLHRSTLLLIFGLSLSAPAFAEAPADGGSQEADAVEQARARFQRGAELYKEGSFDAALAEFTRAYELAPNYRLLYNMGQVELERHDYAAALELFQNYLKQGGSEIASERREEVERELQGLRGRVAELRVTSRTPGAVLAVDGVEVGRLPLDAPVVVSSGVRRVTLSKAGHPPVERTLNVAGGDHLDVALEFQEADARTSAPPRATPEASESSHSLGAGFWIALSATAAFTAGAVTFGVLTHEADGDLDDELAKFPGDAQAIEDARSQLKLYAGLTDGFIGAAVVAACVTTVFALSGSKEPAKSKHAGVNVVPTSRGLLVQGRF